jgi:predicted amino acid-binding ACT domain protein
MITPKDNNIGKREVITYLVSRGIDIKAAQRIMKEIKKQKIGNIDISNFVTKEYLDMKLAVVKAEVKAEFAEVRAEFAEVRAEFRAEFAEVRAEFAEVRKEMYQMEKRLILWILGSAITGFTGMTGVMIAVLKFYLD